VGIIQDRIKKARNDKGLFICVAGPRFGGKTTTLGTLPGKTLLVDIASKESGSRGAAAMAKRLDNTLDVVEGTNCKDVRELVEAAIEAGYDNVAIDGLSALTEVELDAPALAAKLKTNVWDAYASLGKSIRDLIQDLKTTALNHKINVIATVALTEKTNSEGEVTSTDLFAKGKVTEQEINSRCPFFVISRLAPSKEGDMVRILQTFDDGIYKGRLDGVFDSNNPKAFRSDPDKVEPGQPVGLDALIQYIRSIS
jgi:hypothetical protein